MFEIHNYQAFITAILIFQLVPGPGALAILNATARGGTGGGMRAVLGTLSGDFTYMLAAVLGLAALLGTYPGILATAQWIGIVYLCWTGWKLLRSPVPDRTADRAPGQGGRPYFRQALAVSLTNPKVIMFFMAFFPQFLGVESGASSLVIMMVHVTVISLFYQTCLVLVGNALARYLARWRYARLAAARLSGMAFIAFGARLAMSRR